MKRGRPPGKRRKNRGLARTKPGTSKRSRKGRHYKTKVEGRRGETVPENIGISQAEGTKGVKSAISPLARQAWRTASLVMGEGPPGLSLYGEINQGGLTRIFDALVVHSGFGAKSCLLDVGCGTGKVLLHAVLQYDVTKARGVEMSDYRVMSAKWALDLVRKRLPETKALLRGRIRLLYSSVQAMNRWNGVTHVYMYDLGMPDAVYIDLLRLWSESKSVVALVSYRKPNWLWRHGFDLCLLDKIKVKQQGVGAGSHTAYVYGKRQ